MSNAKPPAGFTPAQAEREIQRLCVRLAGQGATTDQVFRVGLELANRAWQVHTQAMSRAILEAQVTPPASPIIIPGR